MPAAFAAAASALPTASACAVLSPLNDFARPRWEADASVRPVSSSTSCASMPRFERKTTRRGRAAEPCTFARTRRCRRRRAFLTVRLGTLPDLSADVLALVADALALVRLGRAHLADLGGRLAHHLLVGALHEDLRRRRHLEGDAGARFDRDGVRVAHTELEIRSFERSPVADTLDLELLLEALRHPLDHVRHECPRQAVQRSVLATLGRAGDDDLAVPLLDLHPSGNLLLQRAERPGHGDARRLDRDGDAVGDLDGCVADSAHCRKSCISLPDE